MMPVYISCPTVITLEKVTNTETKALDGAATIVGNLKDGPTSAASTISGGGSISGSLVSGTTADYTLKIPAGLSLTDGTTYYFHISINSGAGYFVQPLRAALAPSA